MYKIRNIIMVSIFQFFTVACMAPNNINVITLTPVISAQSTETPIPTDSKTPTPSETLTATPKPPDQILYSPNGEYVAEFDNAYGHPAFEGQIIEILDKQNSLLWSIPYQHETAMVDPHPRLSIYGWSDDSSYLYFYYQFSPDGGDFAFWWDGFDLQRIETF